MVTFTTLVTVGTTASIMAIMDWKDAAFLCRAGRRHNGIDEHEGCKLFWEFAAAMPYSKLLPANLGQSPSVSFASSSPCPERSAMARRVMSLMLLAAAVAAICRSTAFVASPKDVPRADVLVPAALAPMMLGAQGTG